MRYLAAGRFDCSYCGGSHERYTQTCPRTGRTLDPVHKMGGTVLAGTYRVDHLLAEGGMGVIYRGQHRRTGTPVAVKFLSSEGISSREAVERFFREARLVGRLEHPGIVRTFVTDITQDGTPYIVMELLEGQDLGQLLSVRRRLGIAEAVAVVEQVLEALHAVHAAGIVHRDLKPENVFLLRAPQQGVKLLDFGVSRLLGPEGEVDRITKAGRVYGTPSYVAPEAARGRMDADHRADIYSAGVLLYEMLCGAPPFEGESAVEVLVKSVTLPAPDPRSRRKSISGSLARVILRSLAKDPTERFQSAGWMLRALRNATGGPSGARTVAAAGRTSAYRIIDPPHGMSITRIAGPRPPGGRQGR